MTPPRPPRARQRLGGVLFAIYCIGYAAFVGVAAFATFSGGVASGGLAAPAVGRLPWGVVAGFLLIAGAFALALLYAAFAPPPEEASPASPDQGEEGDAR